MDKEVFKYALPVGSLLRSPNREYRIEKVLGVGGFGITYKVSATLVYQNVPIFVQQRKAWDGAQLRRGPVRGPARRHIGTRRRLVHAGSMRGMLRECA